jgi:probable F420-dependent oxidoreductase
MKVGVNLINFGPSANPANLRRWAEVTESLGYHMLMTSDHIAVTDDVHGRYPAPFHEPLSTMGWLAGITRNILIGTTVIILPYRSPLEIASAFANIDQLSGGRCILGVGVGWAQGEFEVLKVPFNRRGAMANEYLAAIRTLWTNEVASFDGKFISFRNVHALPAPMTKPHPPIWVGGASDGALRRAVRYGNAWHPIRITLPWLRDEGLPRLKKVAAAEGKPVPDLAPRIRLNLTDSPLPEDGRIAGEGSVEQVLGDLRGLEALGCTHVVLDTFTGDVEATRNVEASFRMLAVMAEQVLDLPRQSVR